MKHNRSFGDRLRELASGDAKEIDALAYSIGTMVIEDGAFPSDCFSALLDLLGQERFLSLEGSWKLLRVFEENWDELSANQRTELLPLLEENYERHEDWMACFVIAGILGELYGDERALAALCRLKTCRSERPRSLVPHAFEHIARDSDDHMLARRAFAELKGMQCDPSEAVRAEVSNSLAMIKKKGIGDLL